MTHPPPTHASTGDTVYATVLYLVTGLATTTQILDRAIDLVTLRAVIGLVTHRLDTGRVTTRPMALGLVTTRIVTGLVIRHLVIGLVTIHGLIGQVSLQDGVRRMMIFGLEIHQARCCTRLRRRMRERPEILDIVW